MGFFEKLKNTWALLRDKVALYRMIVDAVRDGELTDEEMMEIDKRLREVGGFSESDVKQLHTQIYEAAYTAMAADNRITEREEQELLKMCRFFGIPEAVTEPTKKDLARFRLLSRIEEGVIPTVEVQGLVMEQEEICHWVTPVSLLEEKTVNLGYKGGTHGFSVKVSKNVTYRVAAQKGTLVTEQRMVAVDSGRFVITSQRLLFHGNKKAFTVRLSDVSGVKYYSDGIGIIDKKDVVRVVQYASRDEADLVGTIVGKLLGGSQSTSSAA